MTRWLDQILNRVSMYRLMSIALSCLAIVAMCLAQFNLLLYSPIEMIVSAVVLTLSAYGFNVLFGWLFTIKTHDESSFITALILFFLFSPTTDISGLASLALVAMIAMGSKYVLVGRGRHIFNPAAIGAVIIGLLGIAFATWWVATPILMPATLLFTLLILYKTRRIKLGILFLAVAVPLIVLNSVINGQTLSSAITFLASWPLLFFVGFMLTEPLTLPPRNWQKYLVAVIVGVIFALPFDIGSLSSSPALALVIGNAIGFIFSQRRHIQLTFIGRSWLTNTSDEYIFKASSPISYHAGQYIEITLPHKGKDGRGLRRIFSIVGTPGESTIRFGTKMYDRPSSFKQSLHNLKPGTIIGATGIGGDFILPKDEKAPLLFVAGGIGITPFISHLLYMYNQKQHRDIVLIYAVATPEDLAYTDIIRAANIRVIVVTKSEHDSRESVWTHHNASHLNTESIVKLVPDISERLAYVSGSPAMVDNMKSALNKAGAKRISCDYFTGY